jgi:type IX secretion system PorP/SprF family membrane protein
MKIFNYIVSYSSKKILLCPILLFLAFSSVAQDIHFSQFMYSPLTLNPAQTGNFKGSYRLVSNFRRQWSSITIPYQTFGFSADARDFKRIKNLGTGISMYYDRTGDSHFSTLAVNLSTSYRFIFNNVRPEYVSIGIQGGFTQRRIDYSNLSFDNQYNGFYYDPSLPSVETFANAGRIYPNLNVGINYTKYFEKRKSVTGGIALFNITKPGQSFFNNDQIKLDRRLGMNLGLQYQIGDKWDILPASSFMIQGTYKEFILGSSLKYILADNKREYRAIYVGAWGRAKDAGFISVGMDYDEWYFGVSYDVNMSNLRPASNGRGGFEVSVIYIVPPYLPKRLKYKVCPDFM